MAAPAAKSVEGEGGGGPKPMEGDHRDNIFQFFRSHTAYDMLPESGKVLLLDGSVSAYSALRLMNANQQLAVPVWDGRGDRYLGMVTASDMLELVLLCSKSDGCANLTEAMRAINLEKWISAYARPPGCPQPSVELHPDDDLIRVLSTLVRNDCRGLSPPPSSFFLVVRAPFLSLSSVLRSPGLLRCRGGADGGVRVCAADVEAVCVWSGRSERKGGQGLTGRGRCACACAGSSAASAGQGRRRSPFESVHSTPPPSLF